MSIHWPVERALVPARADSQPSVWRTGRLRSQISGQGYIGQRLFGHEFPGLMFVVSRIACQQHRSSSSQRGSLHAGNRRPRVEASHWAEMLLLRAVNLSADGRTKPGDFEVLCILRSGTLRSRQLQRSSFVPRAVVGPKCGAPGDLSRSQHHHHP